MNKFFKNDLVIRLLSLLLAIGLWAYVVIILNPDIEVTINDVPVVYSQTDKLADNNLAIINEQQMKVDLTLKGPRKMLRQINNKNITAMVDLNEYNRVGEYYIPIDINLPINGVTLVSQTPENVLTVIDKLGTAQKQPEIELIGSPRNNYVITNTVLAADSVKISGPDSILKTIDKVVADIDVSGATEDRIETVPLKCYSVNGVEIENDLIKVEPESTEVRCTVAYRKSVKVEVPTKGINAYNHDVSITLPIYSEVMILGKFEDIKDIDTIYTDPVDITYINSPYTGHLKLNLPAGVQLETDINTVEFNVSIDKAT